MADKKLRIEVESKADVSGFERSGKASDELRRDLQQLEGQMEQVGRSTDDLRREIKEQEREFERAQSASIQLKVSYKNLARSGEATEEELRELSNQITQTEKRELDAINATRKLIREFDELEREAGDSSGEFNELGERLNNAEGYIDGVTQAVRRADKNMSDLRGSVDGVGDEMRTVGNKVDDFGNKFDRARADVGKFAKAAPLLGAAGELIADGLQEAAQAAIEFVKESNQAFLDFDRQTREVFTLLPETTAEWREAMKADVLELGTELGRLPDEMLPAVYQALSAGVPEDNVLDTVRTASEAARAGVADLDSTLTLGLSVLNAQVGGVSSLEEVYDLLFFTVKNGVVTMPELNDVMSQVTSVAGEAGVSMQDISSAMIVMTKQGDSAAEAAELLSIMLTQLSTSGTTLATTFEQAAGRSFRQFIAEGGNLAGAMEILQNHAKNTGVALGDILGGGSPFFRDTQAARGALELTGKHLDELIATSEEANEAFGTMGEAAAEMGEAAELSSQQAAAAWEAMKVSIGQQLQPVSEAFYSAKQAVAEYLTTDIEAKDITDDFAATVKGLNIGLVDQYRYLGAATGGVSFLRDTWDDTEVVGQRLDAAIQILNDGFRGSKAELEELIDQQLTSNSAQEDLTQAFVDEALALDTSKTALEERTIADEEAFLARKQAAEGIVEANEQEIESTQEVAATTALTAEERIAQEEEMAAAAEERAARLEAAAEAERAAIQASRQEFGNYALQALDAGEQTINWTDELFRSASAAGINTEQMAILAAATGEYTDEQIEAMLRTAAMRQAVETLSADLANGTITTTQAMEAMRNFQAQLDEGITATLDYSDFEAAQGQAGATRDALLAAEGDYKATFTTVNTTINKTVNETYTRGEGSSKNPGRANYKGGRFRADEFLIVGDGPGGEILPTTELVVFDRPGTIIPGSETNQILNQQLPPLPIPASAEQPAAQPANTGPEKLEINIHVHNAREAETAYAVRDELMAAVRELGLAA